MFIVANYNAQCNGNWNNKDFTVKNAIQMCILMRDEHLIVENQAIMICSCFNSVLCQMLQVVWDDLVYPASIWQEINAELM